MGDTHQQKPPGETIKILKTSNETRTATATGEVPPIPEIVSQMFDAVTAMLPNAPSDMMPYCAKVGHLELAQWLVEQNKVPMNVNSDILVVAAQHNHLAFAKWFVDFCATRHVPLDMHSALVVAAKNCHLEMVQWLANYAVQNASPKCHRSNCQFISAVTVTSHEQENMRIEKHQTTLESVHMTPAAPDNLESEVPSSSSVASTKKADCKSGESLHKAIEEADAQISIVIRTFGPNSIREPSYLIHFIERGNMAMLHALDSRGVDIARFGHKAFCIACERGHYNVVEWLLQKGISPRDDYSAAIIQACANGFLSIAKLLVTAGANVGARDNFASVLAAGGGHLEVLKWIHEQNVGSEPRYEKMLLLSAAQYGHLHLLEWLHDRGVDVTAYDDEALYYASVYDRLDVAKWLVQRGAKASSRNSCSLVRAAENGNLSFVKWLVENGADRHAIRSVNQIYKGECFGDIVLYLSTL